MRQLGQETAKGAPGNGAPLARQGHELWLNGSVHVGSTPVSDRALGLPLGCQHDLVPNKNFGFARKPFAKMMGQITCSSSGQIDVLPTNSFKMSPL